MPKFLIERDIPGAARLTAAELQGIARKSCDVISQMDQKYKWLQSYVAGDKIYCVHEAPSEAVVREHSRRGGFPVSRVTVIAATMDPATAGSPCSAPAG